MNIQIVLYQLDRNGQTHSSTARTRVYETEAERQITQSQNFELTIRIRESTINELKALAWDLHQYKQTNPRLMMR
jgi:chaperonin cofactor prefoldin